MEVGEKELLQIKEDNEVFLKVQTSRGEYLFDKKRHTYFHDSSSMPYEMVTFEPHPLGGVGMVLKGNTITEIIE